MIIKFNSVLINTKTKKVSQPVDDSRMGYNPPKMFLFLLKLSTFDILYNIMVSMNDSCSYYILL